MNGFGKIEGGAAAEVYADGFGVGFSFCIAAGCWVGVSGAERFTPGWCNLRAVPAVQIFPS